MTTQTTVETTASQAPQSSLETAPVANNTLQKPWMTWAVQLLQKSMPDTMKQALIESLKQAEVEAQNGAKHDAVKRLRMVLLHDRTNISPGTIDNIRTDILTVISKYLEVDQETMDLHLEQENNRIALVANIAMIRERELPAEDTDTKSEANTTEAETATASKPEPLQKAVEAKQDDLMDELLQDSEGEATVETA
jgi:cell division topological specificity factor